MKTVKALLAAGVVLAALCGCTPTRYVPVETVRTEYVGKDNAELLSVVRSLSERLAQKERQVDSLMQFRNEKLVLSDKGDTLRHDRETVVYRATYREKELEKLVEAQSDSIRMLQQKLESAKADSIQVPYPVEKRLTRWQQTKVDYGGFSLAANLALLCIPVLWLIKKFRK